MVQQSVCLKHYSLLRLGLQMQWSLGLERIEPNLCKCLKIQVIINKYIYKHMKSI
uniref:Uncharacterized protein n=1 Tax=Lepeophtheirus salmonis TaxID=72036 RepID=A0A0K2VKD4_LEPSM